MPTRIATATLFLVATAVSVFAPAPGDLPALALGQVALYRVEILLALVYGGLLLLTPLIYGAFHGQLPIELSHRGARWQMGPGELEDVYQQVEVLATERAQLLQERRQLEAAAEVRADRRHA